MSETKNRRGWDDRRSRSPESRNHRKRKYEDDDRPRRKDEGRPRDSENHRNRGNEDDDRRRRRFEDDRSRDLSDRNRRNNKDKRSRFEQNFVKEENPSPEWGKSKMEEAKVKQEKEKPNFQTSGKLTEDANKVNGIVVKYSEPEEARKPHKRWRLYPFKGEKALPVIYIHRQSAYLIGRERKVADFPLDHPSISKQHAALQYRLVTYERADGSMGKRIRPYLIDLESANGTYVNDVKLEPRRYHELLEKDVIKFGFSSREFVLLHEQSKEDAKDDDVYEGKNTDPKPLK